MSGTSGGESRRRLDVGVEWRIDAARQDLLEHRKNGHLRMEEWRWCLWRASHSLDTQQLPPRPGWVVVGFVLDAHGLPGGKFAVDVWRRVLARREERARRDRAE